EHNLAFVREAIEREIARGGHVFLLYNRIDEIEKVAREIEELVDSARVSIAHGRMNETELESVMLGFLENESDVLVSTSIIETGVDIPNVNTLIVIMQIIWGLVNCIKYVVVLVGQIELRMLISR